MSLLYSCDNSGHVMPPDPTMVHPVAASGVTKTLTTAGADYEVTVEQGQAYIVTFVATAGKVAFAGITGVTSTEANREWIFMANREYIIYIPTGKTTLYIESDESGKIVYFRKLADTNG